MVARPKRPSFSIRPSFDGVESYLSSTRIYIFRNDQNPVGGPSEPDAAPRRTKEEPQTMRHHAVAAFIALTGFAAGALAADAPQFLADRHAARQVPCTGCHKGAPNADVDMSMCLKCHGGSYAELAKSSESDDINPHDTHLGEAQCVTCHQGHKPPKLSCDNCHEFPDIKVP